MILYDAEGNEVEVEDPQAQQQQETPNVKQMREALDRAKADAKTGESAQRELALMKAGVDTDTTLGRLFAASHAGDLSDIEGTKAAYKALLDEVKPAPAGTEGEGGTPTGEQQGGQQQGSVDSGTAEREALANGGDVGDINSGVDPRQAALDGAKAEAESLRGSEEKSLAFFVGAIADGTAKGTIPQAGQRQLQ